MVSESQRPSLAEEHSISVTVRRPEIITDPFRIVSILSFLDPDKLKGDGDIPEEITVNWTDVNTQMFNTCQASNCKSAQRKCDQYE